MFRERTDASLRTLLMVAASIGLATAIASPIAIRASRAAMPQAGASVHAVGAAQQDYNGSSRRHAATPPLIGLKFMAADVPPAMSRESGSQTERPR